MTTQKVGGYRWDDENCYPATGFTTAGILGIPGGLYGNKAVSFKPLSGLFNQEKYIPLMWGGITLEFEIVGGATDPIIGIGGVFAATDTSIQWSISDVRIVADVVTLDSALQNSYAEHV